MSRIVRGLFVFPNAGPFKQTQDLDNPGRFSSNKRRTLQTHPTTSGAAPVRPARPGSSALDRRMGTFRQAAGEVAEPGGPITVVRSSGLESSTIAQPTGAKTYSDCNVGRVR